MFSWIDYNDVNGPLKTLRIVVQESGMLHNHVVALAMSYSSSSHCRNIKSLMDHEWDIPLSQVKGVITDNGINMVKMFKLMMQSASEEGWSWRRGRSCGRRLWLPRKRTWSLNVTANVGAVSIMPFSWWFKNSNRFYLQLIIWWQRLTSHRKWQKNCPTKRDGSTRWTSR